MHCDYAGCTAQATRPEPFGTPDGWTNAGNTDGCPDHGEPITTHKANITSQTRGRGYREKTTWYLTCACGWKSTPYYATHSSTWLRKQHLGHVKRATAGPSDGAVI